MKIKKFNTINEEYLLFNDKWTEESFDEINKLKMEIAREEAKIIKMVRKYLLLNQHIQEDQLDLNEDQLIIIDFEYYNSNSEIVFSISYHPTFQNSNTYFANLDRKQFNDFLIFLKEPEVYINSRKYNI